MYKMSRSYLSRSQVLAKQQRELSDVHPKTKISNPPVWGSIKKYASVYDAGSGSSSAAALCTAYKVQCKILRNQDMNFEPSIAYLQNKEATLLTETSNPDLLFYTKDNGICSENSYAVSTVNSRAMSATQCDMEASLHRYKSALRIPSFSDPSVSMLASDIEASVIRGKPVIATLCVYNSFRSANVASTGVIPMPNPVSWDDPDDPVDAYLGGLELCIVGYSRDKQLFTAVGCYGTDWGHAGFCYLPYAYVKHPNLGKDFVTLEM
jgi:hypothetical protein